MSYRYWIIAVALGLVFLAANPERNWAQEGNDAQAEKIDIPWPPFGGFEHADDSNNLTEPCQPDSDNRDSDLCAQWKAADAAKKSADWSVYLGIAGAGIGILTLAAAFVAAWYARKAVLETRRIGEAQVRAYMSESGVSFNYHNTGLKDDPFKITIEVQWMNHGQSPALEVNLYTVPCIVLKENIGSRLNELSDHLERMDLSSATCFPNREIVQKNAEFFPEEVSMWTRKECEFVIYAACIYKDVFGKTIRAASCSLAERFTDSDGSERVGFVAYKHHNEHKVES